MSHIRSVAIIDDDGPVRCSIATLVRSLGLSARTFASADEYLQVCDSEPFGCVISDVQMPGLSGVQLQQILVGREAAPPVIMMTAFPSDRVRAQVMEKGAVCFLEKPVDGDTLVGCLESLFGPLDD